MIEMSENGTYLSPIGDRYFVECFDCHYTWWLDTGTTDGNSDFDRCTVCGSFNTMRYSKDRSQDTEGDR